MRGAGRRAPERAAAPITTTPTASCSSRPVGVSDDPGAREHPRDRRGERSARPRRRATSTRRRSPNRTRTADRSTAEQRDQGHRRSGSTPRTPPARRRRRSRTRSRPGLTSRAGHRRQQEQLERAHPHEHILDKSLIPSGGIWRTTAAAALTRARSTRCPAGGAALTRLAIDATLHCLTGCAIGEIAGMAIGTAAGFSNGGTVVLSIVLAFASATGSRACRCCARGCRSAASPASRFASDTLSITTMEIVDNAIVLAVPGAIDAGLGTLLFWGSLAFALAIAGALTVPVNRWLLARGQGPRRGPRDRHPRRPAAEGGRGAGRARASSSAPAVLLGEFVLGWTGEKSGRSRRPHRGIATADDHATRPRRRAAAAAGRPPARRGRGGRGRRRARAGGARARRRGGRDPLRRRAASRSST